MRLEVRASNSHAIRLYDQAGYRVLQRVENYYPDGEAAIRMEKKLVPHLQGL
jgi:ribosomal protein S18 acetylase RimI-like enzyme